jgi:hypothetical protein
MKNRNERILKRTIIPSDSFTIIERHQYSDFVFLIFLTNCFISVDHKKKKNIE